MTALIEARGIRKVFAGGDGQPLEVLRAVDLSRRRGARWGGEEGLSLGGLGGGRAPRPAELSGGEQQRCAVARALVHDPGLVLADEPSGNLDHANSDRLHDVLFRLAREYETAVVVVTHNRQLAGRADRILMLEDGRLAAVGSVDAIP